MTHTFFNHIFFTFFALFTCISTHCMELGLKKISQTPVTLYKKITSNKPFMNIVDGTIAAATSYHLGKALHRDPYWTLAHGACACFTGFGYYAMSKKTPEIMKKPIDDIWGSSQLYSSSDYFKRKLKQQPRCFKYTILFSGVSCLSYLLYRQSRQALKNLVTWTIFFICCLRIYYRTETLRTTVQNFFYTETEEDDATYNDRRSHNHQLLGNYEYHQWSSQTQPDADIITSSDDEDDDLLRTSKKNH